jgi:YrbI family 3-deoxy-D-manno-octulosonate 8-phosphate phosphatase
LRSKNGPAADILKKCRGIRMVAMDVDGVLTDGRIIYSADGIEYKLFDAHDGYGIDRGAGKGLKFAVVSARSSKATAKRARELGVLEIHQGVSEKMAVIRRLLKRYGLRNEELCYIGDDELDRPALEAAGLSAAPADAMPEIRSLVDYVAKSGGGRGAVREVVDMILRAKKLI